MGQFSVEKPVLPGSVLSGNQHLAHFGELLTRAEASDGVLFLGPGNGDRARTLRARAAVPRRIADKTPDLGAQYDLKAVSRLDLGALHRDWKDCPRVELSWSVAAARKRFASPSRPSCSNPVPQDIGRDLLVLQELLEICSPKQRTAPSLLHRHRTPVRHGRSRPSRDRNRHRLGRPDGYGDQDPRRSPRQRAPDLRPNRRPPHGLRRFRRSERRGRPALWLSCTKASRSHPRRRRSFAQHLDESCRRPTTSWASHPAESTTSSKRLDRWTDNLVKAPQWIRWRAAASDARRYGIEPLVAAIEAGEVQGPQILRAFEYAYAKWVADEIVNSDETLSSFLAEHHEAAIEAFSAADDRVAELSKQIVLARIGGGVPGMTSFGSDPEWGTLAREVSQEGPASAAAPALRQDPERR